MYTQNKQHVAWQWTIFLMLMLKASLYTGLSVTPLLCTQDFMWKLKLFGLHFSFLIFFLFYFFFLYLASLLYFWFVYFYVYFFLSFIYFFLNTLELETDCLFQNIKSFPAGKIERLLRSWGNNSNCICVYRHISVLVIDQMSATCLVTYSNNACSKFIYLRLQYVI